MGTSQHFFHECKWHAHIGDAFLNILISYLNFSMLVWIFYEVFKVMVKQSKGKSISAAKWFGQEQVFSETRGKPAECDPTRGIKSIIPLCYHHYVHVLDQILQVIVTYDVLWSGNPGVTIVRTTPGDDRSLRSSCIHRVLMLYFGSIKRRP